jgi:hypothetical protein
MNVYINKRRLTLFKTSISSYILPRNEHHIYIYVSALIQYVYFVQIKIYEILFDDARQNIKGLLNFVLLCIVYVLVHIL